MFADGLKTSCSGTFFIDLIRSEHSGMLLPSILWSFRPLVPLHTVMKLNDRTFEVLHAVVASAHLLFRYSLERAGPVKDVTLDTWLVLHSACSNLLDLLQLSPPVYWLLLILSTPEGMKSWVEIVCFGDRTRTSCPHEWTCVEAANDSTNWASQTDFAI